MEKPALMQKVSIIGQGYVGLTISAFASDHYQVLGFDSNSMVVDQLNLGISHIEGVDSSIISKAIAGGNYRASANGADIAGSESDAKRGYMRQYIYSYSFALSPEEHQPSGTCNFSRIDNAVLQLNYSSDSTLVPSTATLALSASQSLNLNVYAVNYNVLRIMSGMGGLAYSN
jgi:hypothetical protein